MSQAGAGAVRDISVIVPTHRDPGRLETCLDSLGEQTLAADRFEVLVVQNGPPAAARARVDAVRARYPDLRVRYLEMAAEGAGRARNVGIGAATGTYVTFVDDDDWVGPDFLLGLLAAAAPGVVPVALVADVRNAEGAGADLDNYVSRVLRSQSGSSPDALVNAAVSFNAAKLLPTWIAADIGFDEELRSGEDVVFWFHVYARHRFAVAVVEGQRSFYFRLLRDDSRGRQAPDFGFAVDQRLDCIRAIRRVTSARDDVVLLARRLVKAQSMWIRRYLDDFPEDQGRAVVAAQERDLVDLPWRMINAGRGNDLALLYCFPPYLDTSGLVAARRLLERGTVTDVISHEMTGIRTLDPSSTAVVRPVLDRTWVVPGRASFANWANLRIFVETVMDVAAEWQAEKGPYRTVYSRAMAASSHYAAAIMKLRHPDVRWIAEFSDPLLLNADGRERTGVMEDDWIAAELRAGMAAAGYPQPRESAQLYAWAELIAYALADELIFTNEHQRRTMLGYCPDPGLARRAEAISQVVSHPVPPRAYYSAVRSSLELPNGVVNIAYFGVFYARRGLAEIIEALASLSPGERDQIQLHVFIDAADEFALEVLAAGLADVIRVRPYVPYLEFLNLTARFDVLLVNDISNNGAHALNPYLPSKVSDYRGSGTPIWAVVEPGSVLSTVGSQYRTELGDVEGARSVLRELISGRLTVTA